MLRITQQDSAAGAKQYYQAADYLSQGQEIVGCWGGKGAERLGLHGVVDKEAFERLCDNLDPTTGKQLTVRTRSERTVGYDFTFSVPKSVSLLYALSGDRQILDAFRSAVDETMRDIEAEMKTRVRRGGKDEDRTTGTMLWAEFIHTTSRPVEKVPDPQLHAHCFTFNSTWDNQENRWKAGQFRELKRDAPYFQAGFRVRLANKLQDLGFGIERKRDDFEIAGMPAVLKRFSRRTAEIEKVAAEKGITDPKRKAELGAETREKKSKELSWNELRRQWDSRLTEKERQALAAVHRREVQHAKPERGEGAAVDHAIGHCFAREAVVAERKLLTEALKRGIGSVTLEATAGELARRPLIRGDQGGRVVATTQETLDAESRLIAFARKGRGRLRPLCDRERPFKRDWLNQGQKAAVRHVLGSRDRVTIIRGGAGTGKTKLEEEIGDALAEAGRRVVALAPTAEASRGVLRQEAGFAGADTVARFLQDRNMQKEARGGVVLVDEASLLGVCDMNRLFEVVQNIDARVILVGDRKQHRSVAAGEPLKLLEQRAGLPVAQVREIIRQAHGDYRQAAQALSDGKTAEGFAELDKLGWIKEVGDKDRYQALADAYLAAGREKKRNGEHKSALVVTPTHAEAARITHAVREALKAQGKLGKERTLPVWLPAHLTDAQKADAAANTEPGDMLQFHQNVAGGHKKGSRLVVTGNEELPVQFADRFEVFRPGQLTLAAGDRIRITANGKTKDGKHALSNGALYTVRGFTPQGDPIIDHQWVIAKDFGHISHGVAVTSHASQGKTVDKVFVAISSQSLPATTQRTFYVAATRGREKVEVFTDQKKELLKAAERSDEPMSATELAQARRRNVPLGQRLRKHLAFMRRMSAFVQTNEPRRPDPNRPQQLQREVDHAR